MGQATEHVFLESSVQVGIGSSTSLLLGEESSRTLLVDEEDAGVVRWTASTEFMDHPGCGEAS